LIPVSADCCEPLLHSGRSRRYLCSPYVGAWSSTPPRPPGAHARFYPGDIGLTSWVTRSAHGTILRCNFHRESSRGCRHSLRLKTQKRFRLPRSLDPQIAPTDEALSLHGSRAVYTTQPPGWLPAPGRGIASRPTRATGAAGLAPAELQPCRLLQPTGFHRKVSAPYIAFPLPRLTLARRIKSRASHSEPLRATPRGKTCDAMCACEWPGVSYCTEFARNGQRISAFSLHWVLGRAVWVQVAFLRGMRIK